MRKFLILSWNPALSRSFLPSPSQLSTELSAELPLFRRIQWVERTVSTNADLLAQARDGQGQLARPWLLGAHLQERGRGRAGRTWQNRCGANLMFSCAFDVFLPPAQLPTLSPLAGVAACEALRALLDPAHRPYLSMKWPNDLEWKSAKLAGILAEVTRSGASRISSDHYVAIIGMGLNLNDARSLSQSLNRQIADWDEVSAEDAQAQSLTASHLVSAVANAWYDSLNQATAHGFSDFPARYARVDALAGQHINVLDEGRIAHAGIATGVNELGQLLVRSPNGVSPIIVGDISVRPRQPQ